MANWFDRIKKYYDAGLWTATMVGNAVVKDNIMYPNNIYIKNYAEVKKYPGDIGVQLDMFDNAHHLKHNALLRAQYKHWRSVQTGVPELLSVEDKRLLGI